MGLEAGADDYITKPFSLAILRARVHNQLRRNAMGTENVFATSMFQFDFDRMEFRKNGVPVELEQDRTEAAADFRTENRGQTLGRAALVDYIWTSGADYVDENALSVTGDATQQA